MDDLKPCYICSAKMELFNEGGEFVARCSAECGLFLDHLGGNRREAVRGYNRVAEAPL